MLRYVMGYLLTYIPYISYDSADVLTSIKQD